MEINFVEISRTTDCVNRQLRYPLRESTAIALKLHHRLRQPLPVLFALILPCKTGFVLIDYM